MFLIFFNTTSYIYYKIIIIPVFIEIYGNMWVLSHFEKYAPPDIRHKKNPNFAMAAFLQFLHISPNFGMYVRVSYTD